MAHSIERLPTDILPTHYHLHLKPDLENFTFSGDLTIDVTLTKPTSVITLNSVGLTFNDISYATGNDKPKISGTTLENEYMFLTFAQELKPGKGVLFFSFHGVINNNMRGFYRSKCITPDGKEQWAGITQFESTDARRAFPCWDEPAFKSTYDIKIDAPKDLVVLSNMPCNKVVDTESSSIKTYIFDTTPIMSSYLLAWAIGQFDYIEDDSIGRIKVRVYTPLGKSEQGKFALDVAVNALKFYEEFFQIPYPLPKMDLIAIPDFAAGAMENWGLVTYREICLLIDPNNSSSVCKQLVSLVVCHELAHQWFGNLVTMKWWSDLWLKEGFAQFMEYQCVDYLFPEFKIWDQFVIKTYSTALELDSLKSSHPIEVILKNAAEIEEIYDDISYNKGASLIRMLHGYLGDTDFRKGLNIYLERNLYKATETEDLWSALEEASSKPVGSVMKTWTRQMGFPVLSVKTENATDTTIHIEQKRFGTSGSSPDFTSLWMVPINIIKESDGLATWKNILLESVYKNVECENIGNQWIKLNPGMVGFYRVHYEDKLIDRFLPHIKDKTLGTIDRLSIQSDLLAMVKTGFSSTSKIFHLLNFYRDEDDYTVWGSIIDGLYELYNLFAPTKWLKEYKEFARKLLERIYITLGWEPRPDESHTTGLLRNLILETLIFFDDEKVIHEAQDKFDAHISGENKVSPDLRQAIYKAEVKKSNNEIFETMMNFYKKADLQEEKLRISMAMGLFKDVEHLQKILRFSLTDEVKPQDLAFLIASVAQTHQGREEAWAFFKQHFASIMQKLNGNSSLLSRAVKVILEGFVHHTWAADAEQFFKENPVPGINKTLLQSIETIRISAAWLERDTKDIEKMFQKPDELLTG